VSKYQVMPALSQDEYEALKADIAKRGVLIPIEVDEETGEILDGFHRLRACQELGIDPPVVARQLGSEQARIEHALVLNLLRRQVGPIAWAHGFERLAESRGVRLGRGGDRKSTDTMSVDSAAKLAAEVGVNERTARRRLKLADDLADHPDLAEQVDRGELPAKKALHMARRESSVRNDKARKAPSLTGQFDVDIRRGDFREVLSDLPDQSVKLILTDPPYGKKYLPLWDDLGVFANRVLRPDGLLVAYSGQFYLPEVITSLGKSLQWWWLCGVAHKGSGNLTPLGQPVRKVINQFKPLLVFVPQNSTGIDVVFRDLIEGAGGEKEKHNWQQPVLEAVQILETFCTEGDLVVDPFAGSGAFGEAARQIGLPFVGAETLTV